MKNIFLSVLSFLLIFQTAFSSSLTQEPTPREVNELLSLGVNIRNSNDRIEFFSHHFLETPYLLGPNGEGETGVYDPKPLFRFDVFDCTTFVETVLALSFSDFYDEFLLQLKEIKYADSLTPDFVHRNHFTSIHWIPNQIEKNFLSDVTQKMSQNTKFRTKLLNTEKWYEDKILELERSNDPKKIEKIEDLKKPSLNKNRSNFANLSYLSWKELLKKETIRRLSEVSSIYVFNLVKGEHSKLNIPVIIGHQGFLIAKNDQLFFRHASSSKSNLKVVDSPFREYIQERMKDSVWPSLGMHLMAIPH